MTFTPRSRRLFHVHEESCKCGWAERADRHLFSFGWPKTMTLAAKDSIGRGTRKRIA